MDDVIFLLLGLFAFSVIFSVTAMESAMLATAALLLFKRYRANSLSALIPALTQQPLFTPWMVYLGICLLTTITAYYPLKGLDQLNSDFLKYICLATLLLAVKKEHLPKLSATYTLSAVIAALFGIYEVAHAMSPGNSLLIRADGFMDPVRYGEVMGIALALILSRLVMPVKETFKHERLLYRSSIFPVFIALALSQTRGAYLGIITAVCFMFYFARSARKKIALYAAILTVTVGLMTLTNPGIRQRFTAIYDTVKIGTTDPAINIRLELWKLGVTMFNTHPVLGIGPDNVKSVFSKFHPDPIGPETTWGSLHNLYIHQAAERGIIGLGSLLFLFWTMYIFALNSFKVSGNPHTLWALAVLPAYFVMNITEISFQHAHTSFAIFLAITASYKSAG